MPKLERLKNCKFCNVSLSSKVWNQHESGQHHRNNIPAEIFVRGTFTNEEIGQVHTYFKKFGAIIEQKVVILNKENNTVLFTYAFKNGMSHSYIVHKEHSVCGKGVVVFFNPVLSNGAAEETATSKSCNGNKILSPGDVEETTETNSCNNPLRILLSSLSHALRGQKCPFAEQIAIFENIVHSSSSKVKEARQSVHKDVAAALSTTGPNCRTTLFGSTEIGLNLTNSSLDFHVHNTKTINRLPTLQKMTTMLSCNGKFTVVKSSTENGIEMIICKHVKTGILCRVSANQTLRRSDELIKYYAGLDKKIKQLMLLVKFWCNCHYVVGPDRFSNYALYLLIIFFLQQDPYNLPSVLDLGVCVRWEPQIGWKCTFSRPEVTSQTLKNATILELVTKFFQFYSRFDYFSYVIAPFCGQLITKESFIKPYELPSCYSNYMCQDGCIDVGHGICVQDPFEHSVNLLSKASLTYSGNFIAWCRTVSNFSQTKSGLLSKVLLNTSPKCFTLEKPSRFSEDQWKTTIEKVTVDILHKILCYEVSVKRTPSEIAFTCAGTHDLWQNRSTALKTLLPKLSPNATDMEKEIAVTALILSQNPGVVKDYKRPARITVTFDKKSKAHFTRLRMNNHKQHFDNFLYLKIIKYLDEADKQSAVFASPDTTQDIDVKPDVTSPELANIVPKGESTHSNTENVIIKEENSSRNTEIKAENVSDDEVEDVPADFFQDFNRDSFLEGLDLGWVSDEDNAASEKRKRAFCSSDDSQDSTNSCRPKKRRRSGENVPLTLIQEQKDKILSQCEQVLRVMTYQRPKRRTQQFASQGHMSPLFRTNIRFNCTSASRTQFSDCLLTILRSVGIIGESNDVSDVIDLVTEDVASGAVMNKTLIARLLQISLLISKPSEKKVVDGAVQSTSDDNGDF